MAVCKKPKLFALLVPRGTELFAFLGAGELNFLVLHTLGELNSYFFLKCLVFGGNFGNVEINVCFFTANVARTGWGGHFDGVELGCVSEHLTLFLPQAWGRLWIRSPRPLSLFSAISLSLHVYGSVCK